MKVTVYKTYRYDLFNKTEGNRDLNEPHILQLMKSIEKNGYNELSYGKANENMELIDGQHRLEALRRLAAKGIRYPFLYIKAAGADLNDCIKSNELQKNWENIDYIKAYAVNKDCETKEDYVTLLDLVEKYRGAVSISMIVKICTHMSNNSSGLNDVRAGKFRFVRPYDEVVRICDYLRDIKDAIRKAQHHTTYCNAIIWAITNKEIDSEALKYQLKKYGEKLDKATKFEEALRQLSYVYHYNDRRATKLTPTQNFYSIYDKEMIAVKENARKRKVEKQRQARLAAKNKAAAASAVVNKAEEGGSINYDMIING